VLSDKKDDSVDCRVAVLLRREIFSVSRVTFDKLCVKFGGERGGSEAGKARLPSGGPCCVGTVNYRSSTGVLPATSSESIPVNTKFNRHL
jgi:hypothetical protein